MVIKRKVARSGEATEIIAQEECIPLKKFNVERIKKELSAIDVENLNPIDIDIDGKISRYIDKEIRSKDRGEESHIKNVDKTLSTMKKDQNSPEAANESNLVSENIVQNSIRELSENSIALDEYKSNLRALGIRLQTSNVMIELALQGKNEELEKILESTIKTSKSKFGDGAITREELDRRLEAMLALEKDILYTKKLCKERNLDVQAVNILSKLIRQSPGDGGEKVINTIFAYAVLCNVPLSGIEAIQQEHRKESNTVLPDIKRQYKEGAGSVTQRTVVDVLIGVTLAICLMYLLV